MSYYELLNDAQLAIKSYQDNTLQDLSAQQKAQLAVKHPALMRIMLQDDSLNGDNVKALFSTIKNTDFKYHCAAFQVASQYEEIAMSLYFKQILFNHLADFEKIKLAIQYSNIAMQLSDDNLSKLAEETLSFFVGYLTLEPVEKFSHLPSNLTLSEKESILEKIAINPALRKTLYPAARILLLSRLNAPLSKNEAAFDPELKKLLQENPYRLPASNDICFWILSVLGLTDADYWLRFNEVIRGALEKDSYLATATNTCIYKGDPEYFLQSKILAYILITDPRFFNGLKSSHYPTATFCKLSVDQRFEIAMQHLEIAFEIFENQPTIVKQFSTEQLSLLVAQHPKLMLAIIQNKIVLQDDQINAIFTPIDYNRYTNRAYKSYPHICLLRTHGAFICAHTNEEVALALSENQKLFNLLTDFEKAKIAIQHPRLTFLLLENKLLHTLDKESLSYLVSSCVLSYQQSTFRIGCMFEGDRNKFSLAIATDDELIAKIYPATRLFLLARIKHLIELQYFNMINVPFALHKYIDDNFYVPLEYGKNCFWLLAIVNIGDSDYWGRFNDVKRTALGTRTLHTQDNEQLDSGAAEYLPQCESLAYALISDERFINGLKSDAFPDQFFCVLKSEDRMELAKKFPKIALILLKNIAYQGKTPFTLAQCIEIASMHTDNEDIQKYLTYYLKINDAINSKQKPPINNMCLLYDEQNPILSKPSSHEANNEKQTVATLKSLCFFTSVTKVAKENFSNLPKEMQNDVKSFEDHMQLFPKL